MRILTAAVVLLCLAGSIRCNPRATETCCTQSRSTATCSLPGPLPGWRIGLRFLDRVEKSACFPALATRHVGRHASLVEVGPIPGRPHVTQKMARCMRLQDSSAADGLNLGHPMHHAGLRIVIRWHRSPSFQRRKLKTFSGRLSIPVEENSSPGAISKAPERSAVDSGGRGVVY